MSCVNALGWETATCPEKNGNSYSIPARTKRVTRTPLSILTVRSGGH